MCGNIQRVGVLHTVDAGDVADGVGGDDDAQSVKILTAVRLQLVQRVDETQAHGAWAEGVHLNDVTLGGVGAVDAIVEFHDEFGAARQRLVGALHTYIIPESKKKSIGKTSVESITYKNAKCGDFYHRTVTRKVVCFII